MTDRLEQKLFEHESKLVKVETILERVAINQDKMAEAMTQISASVLKQELILEKLSNLEANSKGSFERVHKRVDSIEESFKGLSQDVTYIKSDNITINKTLGYHSDTIEYLEIFTLIKKYPIVVGFICLGLYSLTFEPIRESIANFIGLFG